MDEILHCPYCGGVADVFEAVFGNVSFVDCDSCWARGPHETTEAEAIGKWNRMIACAGASERANINAIVRKMLAEQTDQKTKGNDDE